MNALTGLLCKYVIILTAIRMREREREREGGGGDAWRRLGKREKNAIKRENKICYK